MKKILTCGLNPAWQKTLLFETFQPDAVNRAVSMKTTASGKGVNFARAVQRWGIASANVLHPLGGVTGKQITGSLAGEGIPSVAIMTEAVTRTCSTLMCRSTGTATEIIEPSGTILPGEYENILTVAGLELSASDALAICGTYPPGIPEDCYEKLTFMAARSGKPVLLDAWKNTGKALSSGVTLLKINRGELRELTGRDSVEEGIRHCLEQFPLEAVAITDGKNRAFLGSRKGIAGISVPEITNAVNPIGAGDTCSGVFFSEYLAGTELPEAFARGLCAATASCMTDSPAEFSREIANELRKQVEFYEIKGSMQ